VTEAEPKSTAPAVAPSGPRAAASPPASHAPGAWAVLIGVSVLALATDLGSKAIAFATIADRPARIRREDVLQVWGQGRSLSALIPNHEPLTVIPRVLDFSLVLNPGAVFGMGAGMRWFFVVFTIGALGLALWMFAHWTTARDRTAHIAIGLLIAGGLGNLYDRIVYACVRDFIHPLPGVRIGGREVWPYVSNVADLWLLVGIGILMWHLWRTGDKRPRRTAGPAAPASL
jgi:signal peptidase II